MIYVSEEWTDFELIETGDGFKLEKWGNYTLKRPDPQIIWKNKNPSQLWNQPDAIYHRSNKGGGRWEYNQNIPEEWFIQYKDLKFLIKPTGFKHTGLFPEQSTNWDWMIEKIRNANRPIKVLNLFAYTGGATVAALSSGASVCHVDASKGMIQWAKRNVELSGLKNKEVRFINEDVFKFVHRQIRRSSTYDAILMDPPSYGRGPKNELWKLENELYELITTCTKVLSKNPLFFLVNSYTSGFSSEVLKNILRLTIDDSFKGEIHSGEVGIKTKNKDLILPCGIFGRWES